MNYKIIRVALDTARYSERLEVLGGFLYVKEASDGSANFDIQIDNSQSDKINLKKQYGIITDFKLIFISNTAQSAKWVDILVTSSFEEFRVFEQVAATSVDINEAVIEEATTPTIYNVTNTVASTEYSQALPTGTRKFTIKPRGGALKFCFTASGSGSLYINLDDGQGFSEDNLKLTSKTLYFQSPTAGSITEIIAWT